MQTLPTLKIAITGSLGSGKSTVAQYLRSKNYPVFDADQQVAIIYQENQTIKDTLVKWYGSDVLIDNQVNRPYLRMIFKEDQQAREQVEQLVHPLVEASMRTFFKENGPLVFAEVPLLYEAKMEHNFDQVWFVLASKEVAMQRLMQDRQLSKEQIEYMLSWQMDPHKKSAMATTILYNDNDIASLIAQIDQALANV